MVPCVVQAGAGWGGPGRAGAGRGGGGERVEGNCLDITAAMVRSHGHWSSRDLATTAECIVLYPLLCGEQVWSCEDKR